MPARRPALVAARLAVALFAALASFDERIARADACTSPDLIETMPPDGASGVPINAQLFARYATVAQYVGEAVTLEHVGVDTQAVSVTFDDTEAMLHFAPTASLVAGDAYVVHWPGLRGLDTANLGTGFDQHFTVGANADVDAPTFEGIGHVSWDVTRDRDSCTNSIDERYVFDLDLGAADDDGGRDSLTLLVFQTSGPQGEGGAPAPVLVQRIPPAGQSVRVTRTVDSAVGHVCFAAIVRDLTGKVSTSGAETCVDTVSPPFFYGCAVKPAVGGTGAGLLVLSVVGFTAALRRSRRSRGRA